MTIALSLVIIVLLCLLLLEKTSTVKISDDLPENPNPKNCWMKLQNEGMKYVKIKKDKIYLKIKD